MQEEREIRPELEPGERVLWAGQPRQGLRLDWSDLYSIPFGLFFFGFSVFWTAGAYQGSPIFALFGVPFLIAGAYIAFGRFFVEAQQRARTYYAVTDRRALIVSGLLNRTVKSLDLATLHDVSVTERKNGTGTVDFGSTSGLERRMGSFGSFGFNAMNDNSFQLVERPREVYKVVLEAKRGTLSPAT